MATDFLWGNLIPVANQGSFNVNPDVAAFEDGRWIVVWSGDSRDAIYSRTMDATGGAFGGRSLVFEVAAYNRALYEPVVAVDDSGGYVVAWLNNDFRGSTSTNNSIDYIAFDEDGSTRYSLERTGIDNSSSTEPYRISLATTPDGSALISYDNTYLTSSSSNSTADALITTISPDGTAGNPAGVTGGTWQLAIDVTVQADGSYLATWTGYTSYSDYATEVYTQLFDADGTPHTAVRVNTTTTGAQFNGTSAALEGGGYVVVWEDTGNRSLSSPNSVLRGQMLDANGNATGSQFDIAGGIIGQEEPGVVALLDGGFLVYWEHADLASRTGVIQAQIFAADGSSASGVFDVSRDDIANLFADATTLADGRVAVAWSEVLRLGQSNQQVNIVAQIVDPRQEAIDLDGTDKNDTFVGTAFDDMIRGGLGNDVLSGGDGDDQLFGQDDNDILIGGAGADALDGGAGRDTANYAGSAAGIVANLLSGSLHGGDAEGDSIVGNSIENLVGTRFADDLTGDAQANLLNGGRSNDRLDGGEGNDRLIGGTQNDVLIGGDGRDALFGDNGNDRLFGGNDRDFLYGGRHNDLIKAGDGNDLVKGEAGNDKLFGEAGNDWIVGGIGRDYMIGGSGRDRFDFDSTRDSVRLNRDLIKDFTHGEDRIDVSTIDANTSSAGNDRFRFIGDGAFTKTAGELRFIEFNRYLRVEVDVNGDGRADMHIDIFGEDTLHANDFIL